MIGKIEADSDVVPDRIIYSDDVEEFSLSYNLLSEFVAIRKGMTLKSKSTTVIVARRNIAYGMARMFQMINAHPQVTVKVVRSENEAPACLTRN